MLTFTQFVTELAREEVTLSPVEVREMRGQFGDKILQMGHLREDGSMLVPVDCILEGAQALGSQTLSEAAAFLQSGTMVSMLRPAEALLEGVSEARERKLRELIRKFQSEPDTNRSHGQWKRMEREVFGVEYDD